MKSRHCSIIRNTPSHVHILLLLLFLSVSLPTGTEAQQPSDDDPWGGDTKVNPSIGVVVIVLVLGFLITGCISIYIQQCTDTSSSSVTAPVSAVSRRAVIRGLDQSIIDTFPTFVYSSVKELKIGKESLECAVCLSEFQQDETLRLLPKCDHVFHPGCIDAWLAGHTTCPVCRANLVPDPDQGNPPGSGELVVREDDGEQGVPSSEPIEVRITINEGEDRESIEDITKRKQKLPRSHSTGHSLIRPGEDCERFTLRLPAEVRRQLLARIKLKRATSLVALPRQSSSRRGYRSGGDGSGSSRYGRFFGRSFISRLGSFKSTAKVTADGDVTAVCTGSKRIVTPLGVGEFTSAPGLIPN